MSSPQAMRLVYNFLVLLIISVFAGSIIPGPAPLYQPFFLTASHSTSPIHLQPINANNLTFWINKPTLSYCFDNLNHTLTRCPQGDFTALRWGGYGVGLVSLSIPLKHLYYNSLTASPPLTGHSSPRRPRRLRRLQRRPQLHEAARAILP